MLNRCYPFKNSNNNNNKSTISLIIVQYLSEIDMFSIALISRKRHAKVLREKKTHFINLLTL